ncbi:hypothetical protein Poli38472_009691 [Pythium oligandrum]|uniref:ABC transmembrane type-1 domain-containing protein n=1 Tax=Pythium oligandrum TaxID=41045 RepID=A0A8K1CGQ3_PYTOL|nr:hypothetical protein Poli38472_009691 [Pythium oligandrum]|eukprot:TMW62198.1 hypothetical protein Poli38472_009691 [Pythium oligandrum]
MWQVCPPDTCEALAPLFTKEYQFHVHDQQAASESSGYWWSSPFAMALLLTFKRQVIVIFLNHTIYTAAMVLQPFFAQAILAYLNNRENSFHISSGVVLVVLISLVSLIGMTCLNYAFFISSRIGANMRSIIMDVVFQKALRLSSVARQAYTTGEIVTLMSVDTEHIFHSVITGPWVILSPATIIVTIVIIIVINFPIFVYRRRPFMVFGWTMCCVCLFVMALMPMPDPFFIKPEYRELDPSELVDGVTIRKSAPDNGTKYIILLMLASLGYVIADVAADAVVVEYAQREPEAIRGRTQTAI